MNIKVTPTPDTTGQIVSYSIRWRTVVYQNSSVASYGAWSTSVIFPVTQVSYLIRNIDITQQYYQIGLTSQCNGNNSAEVLKIIGVAAVTCAALTVSTTNVGSQSFTVNVSGLVAGDTWDLSINNGATYIATGLTSNTYTVTTASPSTTYQIITRHNCTNGGITVNSSSTNVTTQSNNYTLSLNSPCSGINSTYTLVGTIGDIVTLRLQFSGLTTWNGQANGAGATITIIVNSGNNNASTAHSYVTTNPTGFNISCDLTISIVATNTTINVAAVLNNSTTSNTASGTLSVVAVNGIQSSSPSLSICYGNSGGAW